MVKLKIGLVGTSQMSFPGNKEAAFAGCAKALKKHSEEMGFELVVYPETVIVRDDAVRAVKAMEDEKIDFLMVQHTSYSAGQLAPVLAKIHNANVGFWAIPEGEAIEGAVPFNSLCSINMHMGIVAHYLKDYKIKVKWFYGYGYERDFVRRLQITVRALTAIKNLKCARIGLVGGVAPGFNDLYDDERNLNKRFEGIYFNRLHEYSELKDKALSYSIDEIKPIMDNMVACACGYSDEAAKNTLEVSARFYKAYKEFISENNYDAIAVSCWPKFQDDFKYSVCSVLGQLNDEGTVMACEGDVLSAVSMLALKYIADGEISTLMDLSAFDDEDETVLLWHCGPAAARYCSKNGYKLGCNYSGMAHEPNKGVTARCGVARDMVFDDNPITVMRLSGECDKLFHMGGEFMLPDKFSFHGSRGWCGNLTLNGEKIGAKDLLNTILVTGFQHHFPVVIGDYTDEIKEFAAWAGLTPIKKVPYADYLQVID